MVDSYLDRLNQTRSLDEAVLPFLAEHGIATFPWGQTVVFAEAPEIAGRIKRLLVRDYPVQEYGAAFSIKFAPDFICVPEEGGTPFFLDTKASVIPILFESYLLRLESFAREVGIEKLHRGDVGEIEREAWIVYNSFFPPERVAICFAAPYHPRCIVIEWCSEIITFYTYSGDRNTDAGGSGTPHVNIHLGSMRTLDKFMQDEFKKKVNSTALKTLTDVVKGWPIQKPRGRVNWRQFSNAVARYRADCPWVKGRTPNGFC